MNPLSLFHEKYLQGNYIPNLCEYYDRSDMVNTTPQFDHVHRLAEIMYVRQGRMSLEIEGKTVVLGRNQFVWIDSGIRHKNIFFHSNAVSMLNIEYNYVESTNLPSLATLCESYFPLQNFFAKPRNYAVFTDNNDSMYLLLKQIVQTGALTKESISLNQVLCTELLLLLANFWKKSDKPILGNRHVQNCIQYLQKHYAQNITIKQLAETLDLHPNYLQKIFKEQTGYTIMDYLLHIRLDVARELLQDSTYSLAGLSAAVGITSPNTLQKAFESRFGKSLQAFQENH